MKDRRLVFMDCPMPVITAELIGIALAGVW